MNLSKGEEADMMAFFEQSHIWAGYQLPKRHSCTINSPQRSTDLIILWEAKYSECEIVLSFMYMAAVIMKESFYYANIFTEINTETLGICLVD